MNKKANAVSKEAIANEPAQEGRWQRRIEIITARTTKWLVVSRALNGVRSPHFWIIAVLMAVLTLVYYADQSPLVNVLPFGKGFFATVHDLHRALFIIPVAYAAVVYRVWGALIASLAFLGILLPRALLFSTYPDPLLRALIFFFFAILVSLLVAVQLNQIEREKKAREELEALHQELNVHVQRLKESQEQLIHAEKLTSMGQMASAIAHEVNNPLSGVLVYTKLLNRKLSGGTFSAEEATGYLDKMESEISRATKTLRSLLDFARPSEPSFRAVDINQVIDQALAMVGHQAELQKVGVVKEMSPSLPMVMADLDQMQQVFTNFILNAIQAMPEGGRLIIRSSADGDERIRVDVEDTGCGISKENLSRLFTPFFTTKEKGKGVGLGLAVAHGIIERHGGRIEVESEVGKGTTFSVYLGVHHE